MIEVRNLNKTYKRFKLEDASFDLRPGKVTGLIGANGAGKSTILRSLIGLVKRDSGEFLVDGQKVNVLGEKLKVGYVCQDLKIYAGQKMSDIAGFVRDIYKDSWDNDLYEHYLNDVFGFSYDLKVKELSTGMRVKFFIALELAKKPDCLLLDEVTSGLDPMVRDDVLDILLQIAREDNIPVFMSSHITEDLEKIAEYIVYIDSGHILLEDTVDNIRKNYYKVECDELMDLDDEIRTLILGKGFKQHQYYVYDTGILEGRNKPGSPAMLSDVLRCLRKER